MICKKCGTQLPDNARFCGYCGASFDELTSSMTNSADSNYSQQPIYNNNVNMTPVKKNNKILPVIIGIVAVIAAIVGGIIIYSVTYSYSYNKNRDRSYSYSSSYSSSSKGYNDENSIQQFEFSVDYVKESYLDGYENQTIGRAFDVAFNNPEWDFEKDGSKQYVEFYGEFETSAGNEVGVLVDFVYNPFVHNEGEFEIESVFMNNFDNTSENVLFSLESDVRTFLNYVYNGENFSWEWD